jgi:hypothetical protein
MYEVFLLGGNTFILRKFSMYSRAVYLALNMFVTLRNKTWLLRIED